MILEKQVCTLEQAKRLKELGVEQESIFVWGALNNSLWYIAEHKRPNKDTDNTYSAFTVAELGVMLPTKIKALYPKQDANNFEICLYFENDSFVVCYENHGLYHSYATVATSQGDTEAKVRAAMIIHLLENGIITPEEVNARLKD